MQLSEFEVLGLFGRYNHKITFPVSKAGVPSPSLVILHGPNGVGKTTILRMIDGFMRLDFDVFREAPFKSASLKFSSGKAVQVHPTFKGRRKKSLEVSFDKQSASLHPSQSGPLTEAGTTDVELFREKFRAARETLNFEFIDTSRIVYQRPPPEDDPQAMQLWHHNMRLRGNLLNNPKAILSPERMMINLGGKVERFINEAQVNHRRFFAGSETDLFGQILQKLSVANQSETGSGPLLKRLQDIRELDKKFSRLGIEVDNWDYRNIEKLMAKATQPAAKTQAVVALSAFVEVLESRTIERSLLADRLETFMRVVSEFFHDKTVTISPKAGLVIRTMAPEKRVLKEQQLSTGEYHLLYLMVAALVTQRSGTVVAIDEPEMSMHLAWQRKLIRGLFECSSKGEPQFIFATHSPDVAADFPDALIEIGD